MSVRRGVNYLRHYIHKGEYTKYIRHYFSLLYTLKRAIKNFGVKVDVQKGTLRSIGKFDSRCVSLSNTHFHQLLSYNNSSQ